MQMHMRWTTNAQGGRALRTKTGHIRMVPRNNQDSSTASETVGDNAAGETSESSEAGEVSGLRKQLMMQARDPTTHTGTRYLFPFSH